MVFFKVGDNANLEQLSVVLRFVDKNSKIREEVLDFQFTDIPYCRGQEYHGASNLSSKAI